MGEWIPMIVKMELRSANRDVSQALSAIKDGQIGIDQVWKEFSVLKEALKRGHLARPPSIPSVVSAAPDSLHFLDPIVA
ncbi:hypothetical protein AK812_SmicGene38786 [Symbiodinium microadriaticum]|uniref:Uncharacterized protein n=1 Tax=Symbiodinium microadriaticum TaxID=2951 RepID=A0A1Q9CD43_SYMMI|nr:hypothetical protein AK812_SmicGene38786 [Symbiodinium microadriaticum]